MSDSASSAAVCIMNIGPGERRKRMRFGVACTVVGLVAATLLLGFEVGRLWRVLLFLPFWLGGLGVYQARDAT